MTLDEAIERLSALLDSALDWTELARFLPGGEDEAYRTLGAGQHASSRRSNWPGWARRAPPGRRVRAALLLRARRVTDRRSAHWRRLLFAAVRADERRRASRAYAGPTARTCRHCCAELAESYAARGIELVERGGRWHVPDRTRSCPCAGAGRARSRAKLSRAAVETLAIIAYHEPVTRAGDRGDPRRRRIERNARCADGGGLGPARRSARDARAGRCNMRRRTASSCISACSRAATCLASTT